MRRIPQSFALFLIRSSPLRSANAQHQSHDLYRSSSARNRISDNYRNNNNNHDDSQCASTCDSSKQREAHQAKKPLNNIGDIPVARQEAQAEFRRPSGLSCSSTVHPLAFSPSSPFGLISFRPSLFVRSIVRLFVPRSIIKFELDREKRECCSQVRGSSKKAESSNNLFRVRAEQGATLQHLPDFVRTQTGSRQRCLLHH